MKKIDQKDLDYEKRIADTFNSYSAKYRYADMLLLSISHTLSDAELSDEQASTLDEAAVYFLKVLSMKPNNIYALYASARLGQVYFFSKKYELAKQYLEPELNNDTKDNWGWKILAYTYAKICMLEHALKKANNVLKDLVTNHPTWKPGKEQYAECLGREARILLDKDEPEEAQLVAKKALEFANNQHNRTANSVLKEIERLRRSKETAAYEKAAIERERQQKEYERARTLEKEERIRKQKAKQNKKQQEQADKKAKQKAEMQNIKPKIEAKQREIARLQSEFESYMASSPPLETIMEHSQAFQENITRIMEEINTLATSDN